MAKKLNKLDLYALPSIDTPPTGFVAFAAKSDGLYQKLGTVESKLVTITELNNKVKTDVPAGALFTDTKYTHPSSHPASMITESTTKRFVSDVEKGVWNAKSDLSYVNSILPTNTKRNFVNGTLISTNINYANASGDPFYVNIKGNSYGRNYSVDTTVQGYIYSNAIINYGVTHRSFYPIDGIIALNIGGNLCFWFPRHSYWEGYSINVTTAFNYNVNRIISITDVAKPSGTKEVNLSSNTKQVAFHNDNLSNFIDNIGVATHIANKSNPHSVTKAQVGLGNADNTADSDKNVLSATKLTTARTIGGVSFNGSANINLPGVNTAGNQNTSGNAATATTLATTRAINGTNFNGSAAITTALWGTARTLSFTGDVTGSSSVNGSANVATAMTLANVATAGTYRSVTINAKGLVTSGTNPTTLSGYGITDAVTTNTTQTITGAKTFSKLLTASAGLNTPKVDFGNGFTIEPSGTELVFKFNGVTKQRMLSDGSIVAVGEVSAITE